MGELQHVKIWMLERMEKKRQNQKYKMILKKKFILEFKKKGMINQ